MGEGQFLAGHGQVEFLVGPEVGNQFFDPSECLVEGRWHLCDCARESGNAENRNRETENGVKRVAATPLYAEIKDQRREGKAKGQKLKSGNQLGASNVINSGA